MKKLLILIFALNGFSAHIKAQFLGVNMVNFETYTDSISNEWLLDCYNSGDTMSFRLRGEVKKGFTDIQNYINFDKQAKARNITVKFMYCLDHESTALFNFNNISALINSGAYVPDVEIFNEHYAKDPNGDRGTCAFDFNCYKTKFEPNINLIKATYPNMQFFFSLAPNYEKTDASGWNNAIKDYIVSNPNYHIVWHLYYNNQDCPVLGAKPLNQLVTADYSSSLDNYYSTLHNELIASTLLTDVETYLNTNFAGKKVAYTEIGIIGGDPAENNTGAVRNTFEYANWMYYLITNLKAYEIDIHAGISIVGIITPSKDKFDVVDGFKNKKRYEYYALYLAKNKYSTPKAGTCYLPITTDPEFTGLNIESITYEYASSPYKYSSCGATDFMARNSLKSYVVPLGTGNPTGNYFGYQKVVYVNECYDTLITTTDTTFIITRELYNCPPRCSGFFYSIFNGKKCKLCGTYIEVSEMVLTDRIINETICN